MTMPSTETICFYLAFLAAALGVGAILLRIACSLANGINRAATHGASIPKMSYWDAAVAVFLGGMLAALSLVGLENIIEQIPAAESNPGLARFVIEGVAAALFIVGVTAQLPTGGRTSRALKLLAATIFLGLAYGGFVVGKTSFGIIW